MLTSLWNGWTDWFGWLDSAGPEITHFKIYFSNINWNEPNSNNTKTLNIIPTNNSSSFFFTKIVWTGLTAHTRQTKTCFYPVLSCKSDWNENIKNLFLYSLNLKKL